MRTVLSAISLHPYYFQAGKYTSELSRKTFLASVRNWIKLCAMKVYLHDLVGSAVVACQLELGKSWIQTHVFHGWRSATTLARGVQMPAADPDLEVPRLLL